MFVFLARLVPPIRDFGTNASKNLYSSVQFYYLLSFWKAEVFRKTKKIEIVFFEKHLFRLPVLRACTIMESREVYRKVILKNCSFSHNGTYGDKND